MNAALASFARFALVGLAGSLVYFALLWSMVDLLGWPVMLATCCAFLLVVAENYLLQRIFRARRTFSYGKDTA